LKHKKLLTNTGNSEDCFETKFSPKTISIESMYYLSYPITLYGCEI